VGGGRRVVGVGVGLLHSSMSGQRLELSARGGDALFARKVLAPLRYKMQIKV